jgi:hypothetical protein
MTAMHNAYAIELEADFRRHEWQREVVADARAALAVSERVLPSWMHLPRLSLPSLNLQQFSALPRLPFSASPMRQTAECSC